MSIKNPYSSYSALLEPKKTTEDYVAQAVAEVVSLFIEAFFLMAFLAWGHRVVSAIPAWGYWDSFGMILLSGAVFGIIAHQVARVWKSV